VKSPPFHPGEEALQARAGVRDEIEALGQRIIRDHMPDQHRALFSELPMVLVGSLDERDRPWASVLVGEPGFLRSPDPRTLIIESVPPNGDPLAAALVPGAPLGLLGIQLETRRRNRMNGTISEVHEGGFSVQVVQSFGNCKKYIQSRELLFAAADRSKAAPAESIGSSLPARAASLVANADTFFIATSSPGARGGKAPFGIDVSHRGGRPGFVRVTEKDGTAVLSFPDFVGNDLFNTLGNLMLDPRAGLVFVDFEAGDLLQLTGDARVEWGATPIEAFPGVDRFVHLRVHEGRFTQNAIALRWSPAELARELVATGRWATSGAVNSERPKTR
jgi:predicted pyridoxine 5'-phosphate oxidase superfamily flavin-nucleotide-binding protein